MEQLIVKRMYESGCRLIFDKCFSCTSWLEWVGGNWNAKIKTSTILRQGEKSDATHLLPTVRKEAVVWLVADGWDEKNRKKAGEEALEAGPHPGRPSSHTVLCCAVEALPYYALL